MWQKYGAERSGIKNSVVVDHELNVIIMLKSVNFLCFQVSAKNINHRFFFLPKIFVQIYIL